MKHSMGERLMMDTLLICMFRIRYCSLSISQDPASFGQQTTRRVVGGMAGADQRTVTWGRSSILEGETVSPWFYFPCLAGRVRILLSCPSFFAVQPPLLTYWPVFAVYLLAATLESKVEIEVPIPVLIFIGFDVLSGQFPSEYVCYHSPVQRYTCWLTRVPEC